MSYPALRDYLKNKIAGVPGIGVVHDYDRWAADWASLIKLYVANDKLNGWHVTRKTTAESWDAMPVVDRNHIWEIVGIYALNDVWSSRDGATWQCETRSAPWTPRWQHTSVVLDGRIWVLGGARSAFESGDPSYATNDIWYYSPPTSARSWQGYR